MSKVVVGVVTVTALVAAAFMLAPMTTAQGNSRVIQRVDPLLLEGPGSSIGVSVRDLNSEEISKLQAGVRIDSVREDTPAARAGLRSGDVVVEFDGEAVRSVRQFTRLVRETPPGRLVKATIVRDGSRRTLDVTPAGGRAGLERFPNITNRAFRAIPRDFAFDFDFNAPERFGLRASPRRLGATLTPLTDQLASYFGVKEGALVSSVEPDSPAAQAGIKAGDVITSVNGRTVEAPSHVSQAIGDAQPGSSVEVRVMRDRKEMTLKATLPERRGLIFGPDRFPI